MSILTTTAAVGCLLALCPHTHGAPSSGQLKTDDPSFLSTEQVTLSCQAGEYEYTSVCPPYFQPVNQTFTAEDNLPAENELAVRNAFNFPSLRSNPDAMLVVNPCSKAFREEHKVESVVSIVKEKNSRGVEEVVEIAGQPYGLLKLVRPLAFRVHKNTWVISCVPSAEEKFQPPEDDVTYMSQWELGHLKGVMNANEFNGKK